MTRESLQTLESFKPCTDSNPQASASNTSFLNTLGGKNFMVPDDKKNSHCNSRTEFAKMHQSSTAKVSTRLFANRLAACFDADAICSKRMCIIKQFCVIYLITQNCFIMHIRLEQMASASKQAASRLANNIHNANFWTVGSLFRQPNINNCHVDRWMSVFVVVFVVIFIIITIMMIRYAPAPRKLRRGGGGQTVSLGILVGVGMYFRIFFFFSKGTIFDIRY